MSEAEKEGREGFLSRWSRRKRELAEAPEPPAAELTPDAAAPDGVPAEGELPEATRAACPIPEIPPIDPATLPPVESLTAESDFSLFLRPGVPTLLRNAALRRMWSLDPAIRDYIGPVDYQWDFNTPGGLPFGFANELVGDVQKLLAQAIGKIEELAEDKPEQAEAAAAGDAPPDGTAEAESPPAIEPPPPLAPPTAALVAEAPAAYDPLDPPPAPRRRHGGALPA